MSVEFTPWPAERAAFYRRQGLWQDRTLTDILQRQVKLRPEAVAVVCSGHSYTYKELDQASDRLARSMRKAGVNSGEKALVLLPNSAQFYAVYFAMLKARVASVYALFSHNRLELKQYLKQLQPKVLIASGDHPLFGDDGFLNAAKEQTPSLSYVHISDSSTPLQACWPDGEVEQAESFALDAEQQAKIAGEVAFFQLSGGSTGIPKLIPRTHNDYLYSIVRSVEVCEITDKTVYLTCLPAGHNFALSSPGALGIFEAGGTVVTSRDVSPVNCLPLMAQTGVNMAALVPSALHLWVEYVEQTGAKIPHLKLVQVGGAKLDPKLAAKVPTVLGAKLQQVYGMAEGLVNYTRLDDDQWHVINTQGRPMCRFDEVRVIDEQGKEVAQGQTGQLEVRGAYTFCGYYQSPEHNRSAFSQDGFYRTGDLVTITPNGYISVVGRVKDQINRGGEKIAAEEVETLLTCYDSIVQAAVVSIPDAVLGEKSLAFLVMPDAKLSGPKVRKYLREEGIAAYKIPDRFVKIDTLPLTAVGKIDKKKLRALHTET